MWHTVSTIFKRKGEEGQNKKYFAEKKMERRKSKVNLVLTGTHKKR
jgi:hypothetical protein